MRYFSSLVKLLPMGRNSRSLRLQAQREERLRQAYYAVFIGKPTDDDQNIVLLDLADVSGFYKVSSADMPHEYQAGMRAVYGRIFSYLRMSPDEIRSLEQAAHETAANRERLENHIHEE
jgi:hypothetical protein